VRRALLIVAVAAATAVCCAPAATARRASTPPRLQAASAILVQPDTEDVPFRRAATQRLPIASTTKLMTALLTLEHAKLDETVTAAAYDPEPDESVMGLRAGQRLTIRDLLKGLLLPSGNDAAHTLAVRVGGTQARFVRMMNRRARRLGLTDTHYANPIGLDDPRNYSSAEDLAKLALVLLQNRFFRQTVNRASASVTVSGRTRTLVNTNTLLDEVPWADGVKTGHTSRAGYVLVGAARRDGVRLVSVVIDAPTQAARDADSLALLRFGLRRYRSAVALRKGRVVATPTLDHRDATVDVIAARSVRAVVRRGEAPAVRVTGVPRELTGPLRRGQRVGTAVVSSRGRVVARVALVTSAAVAAASVADRASSALPPIWVLVLAAVAVACSLHLGLRHRRRVRWRRERAQQTSGGTETA
jgi:serine-type D-Ala-D-Ala carboxypeptidase (penicillin-binding protein 5/6)